MRILGLSFDYHDAAAALLVDGALVVAGQEERFTRRKHDASLPVKSIEFCLSEAGLASSQIDYVAFYEKTALKFDRIVRSSIRRDRAYLQDTLASWLREEKFDVRRRIADAVPVAPSRIISYYHHESHAASAFFCSPFNEATVLTIDGVGENETAGVSIGKGAELKRLTSIELPHSLGLLYSAFTAFLGFEVNEGEYKVMGMAGFGQPRFLDDVMRLITLKPDGGFRIDQTCFEFLCPKDLPYRQELIERFGPARQAESMFAVQPGPGIDDNVLSLSRRYADIAASIQKAAENVIMHMAAKAVERTGIRNLCMAGGVALNSLANGRLIRECGYPLYVHPAAGDAGGAVGAALLCHHKTTGGARTAPLTCAYLGRAASEQEIKAAIAASGFLKVETAHDDDALVNRVADLLAGGAVIGWFQGRAEWGPRALGCRSILADPTRTEMQRRVNESIKFREPFRPFAPVTPVEVATSYFDMPEVTDPASPEYFMLAVHPVRQEMRHLLPAITHADGTARVQVVSSDSHRLYHALLHAFGRRSGVPVLLNTSFNLRGEPIVDTPADALKTFAFSGLDAVVLGRHIVFKGLDL
ncbi:MAG: hypothetical protein A3G18_02565 [Rhodospirillales bacterium RIFCSPLOWO2_12_FULL_58_28]|nr:MAG: hypothetical protein A3H92_06675 [Rhodospirillales bacterium RIFCSPLOWO2_02_FULL_58_16]OHC78934.1 MAG: hypothetical protein A3G18_02565 [Rhodospirillales bacterium RIFCSPLOWO2_12_FULL_58_28]